MDGDPPDRRQDVAVIVPAYNAVATIADCLSAIAALDPPPDAVMVIDDGSTDATATIAARAGARVVRAGTVAQGPARARNVGAAAAAAELLLFVDADVLVAPGALRLLTADLMAHDAQAAFGSYDDAPRSRRPAALYANLRHHFVHQHGRRDTQTFWSGLGLIRRETFVALGGFDSGTYRHPSIEDIDLGLRLSAQGGRIRLVPEAQGKHCKDWTRRRLWHTDIARRAAPWSRLIVDRRTGADDLNLASGERIKALVALSGVAFVVLGLAWPRMIVVAAAAAAVAAAGYLALNIAFVRFLAARMQPAALIEAIALHWCYHIYASATYGAVRLLTPLGSRAAPVGDPCRPNRHLAS